ncbi:MAG TPA: acyl carrier protein [Burkholderiales bacterium]|nr:acyl carrier protein [Burkholderiales bacterium]
MKEALRKFIVDNYLFGRALDLSDDDSFLENGIIDSTGVLELIAHLESTYGVTVKDEELLPENLDSINRLERYIGSKLESRAAGELEAAR